MLLALQLNNLLQSAGSDTTPDPLTGETKSGQPLSTSVVFTTVTPTGYTAATTIALSGAASGLYKINNGSYTASAGTLNPGDSYTVKADSAATYLTNTDSVITLDGTITGTYRSVTTIDPSYTSSRIKINNGFGFGF